MSFNGKIIGRINSPSDVSASGVWSLNEVALNAAQINWPGSFAKDPYFNNVNLLLHMDGSNGGTSFIDNSQYSTAITPAGAIQTSTGVKKFGTASARFALGADYLTFTNTNMNFGTGSFTVEFWLYYNPTQAATSYGTFFDNGGQGLFLSLGNIKSRLLFYAPSAGLTDATGFNHAMVADNWYHIAFVRNVNACTVYVEGISIGTVNANGGSMDPLSGSTAYIGTYSGGLGSYCPGGYIDDFRITKGIARYTSNFTVPSKAFPNA